MISKQLLEEILDNIAEGLNQVPLNQVISVLRHTYPHVHFSYCLDDDVTHDRPVFSDPRFNLYLIDGRDHCLALTTDAEIATGILVAEVGDDEDDE